MTQRFKRKKSNIRRRAVNRCDSLGNCVHLETTVAALLHKEQPCCCLMPLQALPAVVEQINQWCTSGTQSEVSVDDPSPSRACQGIYDTMAISGTYLYCITHWLISLCSLFGLFFTNSQCRMGIKVKYRAKRNRMTTFGLNTADSDFMAHQEGVVCRWEGVRSNNSSLTQHSEEMQWEKRQRGAREEEQKQDTNHDRSQIKRRWIGKARESDRAQKKKTEDHFEESPSLWSA